MTTSLSALAMRRDRRARLLRRAVVLSIGLLLGMAVAARADAGHAPPAVATAPR